MRTLPRFAFAFSTGILMAVAHALAAPVLPPKSVQVVAPDRATAVHLAVETLRRMGYRPTYIDDQRFFRIQSYWDITIKQITQYQDHPGAVITSRETGSKEGHETLDVLVGEKKDGRFDIEFKIFSPPGVGGSSFDAFKFSTIYTFLAADEFLKRGDNNQAASLFSLALIADGTNAGLRNNYGVALARSGHPAEALSQYREAFRLAPGEVTYAANAANLLRSLRRYDEAIATYRSIGDFRAAAQCLFDAGRNEEGLTSLRSAVGSAPNDLQALYELGFAAERLNKRDEAIAAFRKLAAVETTSGRALAKIGHYDLEDNRLTEAVTALRTAIERSPNDSTAHYDLGRAYVAQKLRKDAALAEAAILQKLNGQQASDLQTLIDGTTFAAAVLSAGHIVIARRAQAGGGDIESRQILSSDHSVIARLVLDQPASQARPLTVAWLGFTQPVTIAAGARELSFSAIVQGTTVTRSSGSLTVRVLDPAEGDRPVASENFQFLPNVASAVMKELGTTITGTAFRRTVQNGKMVLLAEATFYYDDESIGVYLDFSTPPAPGFRFRFDIVDDGNRVLMGGDYTGALEANALSAIASYNVLDKPMWRGSLPSALKVYIAGVESPIMTLYIHKDGVRRPR